MRVWNYVFPRVEGISDMLFLYIGVHGRIVRLLEELF